MITNSKSSTIWKAAKTTIIRKTIATGETKTTTTRAAEKTAQQLKVPSKTSLATITKTSSSRDPRLRPVQTSKGSNSRWALLARKKGRDPLNSNVKAAKIIKPAKTITINKGKIKTSSKGLRQLSQFQPPNKKKQKVTVAGEP